MRLINTHTKEFEEFVHPAPPPYAILSHTWGTQEISFQELRDFHNNTQDSESLPHRKQEGWTKITETCRLAGLRGLHYAWIDTCCIDKSSSAELQEAINSMFTWYQEADFCLAYLSDVPPGLQDQEAELLRHFERARWFTRGWTLQELLGPIELTFFDRSWNPIGSKVRFASAIQSITGIDIRYLITAGNSYLPASPTEASIAERMSWAAKRETTRIEDRAYSLLGIFDIHMPMLYGEGDKAFIRLQEELVKVSDDASLHSWGSGRVSTRWSRFGPAILAESPADFVHCAGIIPRRVPGFRRSRFAMAPRGMTARVPLIKPRFLSGPSEPNSCIHYAILGCGATNRLHAADGFEYLALPLFKTNDLEDHERDDPEFMRMAWAGPVPLTTRFIEAHSHLISEQSILILRPNMAGYLGLKPLGCRFSLKNTSNSASGLRVTAVFPPQPLDRATLSVSNHEASGTPNEEKARRFFKLQDQAGTVTYVATLEYHVVWNGGMPETVRSNKVSTKFYRLEGAGDRFLEMFLWETWEAAPSDVAWVEIPTIAGRAEADCGSDSEEMPAEKFPLHHGAIFGVRYERGGSEDMRVDVEFTIEDAVLPG